MSFGESARPRSRSCLCQILHIGGSAVLKCCPGERTFQQPNPKGARCTGANHEGAGANLSPLSKHLNTILPDEVHAHSLLSSRC